MFLPRYFHDAPHAFASLQIPATFTLSSSLKALQKRRQTVSKDAFATLHLMNPAPIPFEE